VLDRTYRTCPSFAIAHGDPFDDGAHVSNTSSLA
jgi:hypothetical protein